MRLRVVVLAVAPAAALAGCAGESVVDGYLDGARSADAARLVVHGVHNPCQEALDPEVVESATQVRVRVRLRQPRGACTDKGIPWSRTVELESPLGERAVVDVVRDRPVEVVRR